jgi:hypothetical protein
MRFALTITLALGLAVAAAAPASAQWTGSRIGRDATEKDVAPAMAKVAECMVKRQPARVEGWLATLPGTAEESAQIDTMTEDAGLCVGSDQHLVFANKELIFSPRNMRQLLATGMAVRVLRENAAAPALDPESQPWFAEALSLLPRGSRLDVQALAMGDFGHCVAVRDWAGSRALLLSAPGSSAERAALNKLAPSLGPCLTEDSKLTLTAGNIRAILAEPVYHLARRAPGSTRAGTAL